MAASYKRMLKLLEKWPIDQNKKGKDLGEFLQKQLKIAFETKKFETNPEECDRTYLSLKRISEDQHLKSYPRRLSSTATGLTPEQCNEILSPEFLEVLDKEDKGLLRNIFSVKSKQ